MIVNAAIFTCSICGEASSNICSYCTKDACANHRCERCKRCSDCCECEFPLSAEEPLALEAAVEPLPALASEPQLAPDLDPEPLPAEPPAPAMQFGMPVYLTAAESSVFVEGSVFTEPAVENLDEDLDEGLKEDLTEPHHPTE
jgi:hypothetical protein